MMQMRFNNQRWNRHLKQNKDLPTKPHSVTIRRIWKEMAEARGKLIFVFFLIAAHAVLGVAGPFMIGYTLDEFIYKEGTDSIFLLLLTLAMIYLFYSLTGFLQNYLMIDIAQNTVYRMRNKLFFHFQQLPLSFFDKRQHGELMSRITNDMDQVSSTLNSSVIQIFSSLLTISGTLVVMFILSPLLTLVTLTVVPLMIFGMRWITNRTGKLFKEQQKHLGDLNGYIEETISGQKIIKTYSQEKVVMDEFLKKSSRLKEAGYWAQTYSGFIPKLMNLLNNLSFALIGFIGGVFALHDLVTIGVMVSFAEYSRQFTRPLNELANQFNALLSAIAGAERVFDILDMDLEEKAEENTIKINKMRGEVEFKEVGFSYEDTKTIKGVTFHVKPGETVALVGPTGAGKTTMINLLMRFYDPEEGTIFIDGKNITKISRENLRSHMGFVLQDGFLFKGTIIENIRYGRLDATDREVIEAAKEANAHSFIKKLPNGYQTVISQDGGAISQGERQLIAIARAILRNPAILIMDEATSNIDTLTELKIQDALSRLVKGRTTFIIAHRLNTILRADQIFVIDNGRIIERGNHSTLMKKRGFYYNLYKNGLDSGTIPS